MTRRQAVAPSPLLGLLLAVSMGCVAQPPAAEIPFPTYGPMSGEPTGILKGKLVLEGRCLAIDDGGLRYVALWPAATSPRTMDGSIAVTNRDGQLLVRLGETATFGGGEYKDPAFVEELVGTLPEGCDAERYWLVTAITRT